MDRYELSINEWYEKSHTADLKYLDLASNPKTSRKELAHNLAVIYDRVCLGSKVHLKNSKAILLELQNQQNQINSLERKVRELTKHCKENKPLTSTEVRSLTREISKQPKIVVQSSSCWKLLMAFSK